MATRTLNAAMAAGATLIAAPAATTLFNDQKDAAYKLHYRLREAQMLWLQDRCEADLMQDPAKARPPTSNALMLECRQLAVDVLEKTWFILQDVVRKGKTSCKYLRISPAHQQRILFLNATVAHVKRYFGDPMIFFVVPEWSASNARDLSAFFVRFRDNHRDTATALTDGLTDFGPFPRVFQSMTEVLKSGMKFHALMGIDVCYRLPPERLNYLMHELGARRMVHVAFLPPELVFPEVPASVHYGMKELAACDYRTADDLRKLLLSYVEERKLLENMFVLYVTTQSVKQVVVQATLDVVDGTHLIVPTVGNTDEHWSNINARVHQPSGDSELYTMCWRHLDSLDAKLMTMTDHSTNRDWSWSDFCKDVVRWLHCFIRGNVPRDVYVYFTGAAGGNAAKAYINDRSVWGQYCKAGWSYRTMFGKQLRMDNYTLENVCSFGHHYLQVITRHGDPGLTARTWVLHEADRYVSVMDVRNCLTRFGVGVRSQLPYISVPAVVAESLMKYLHSISRESLCKEDAPANAMLWLRKVYTMTNNGNIAEGRPGIHVSEELFSPLALAAVMQVQDERGELDKLREEMRGQPVLMVKVRNWFYSTISDTVLGDFLAWLWLHRWNKKFILRREYVDHNIAVQDALLSAQDKVGPVYEALSPVTFKEKIELQDGVIHEEDVLESSPKTDGCMICDALVEGGFDLKTVEVLHNPVEVVLKINTADWRALMNKFARADRETPAKIQELEEKIKNMYIGQEEISGAAKIYNITGLPGTGKSYLLRVLATRLYAAGSGRIGLFSPFMRLNMDYTEESKDHRGRPLGKTFWFKTPHRAMLDFVGLKYIFVEELGAVNFEFLAPLAVRNPGVTFVMCGDRNQTQLQAHEGKNMFVALKEHGLHGCVNDHVLKLNRRNPVEHVKAGNAFLPKDQQMIAHRTTSSPIQLFNDLGAMTLAHPDWQTYHVMAFAKNDWKSIMGDVTDEIESTPTTVRASQGMTKANVVLLIGPACKNLLRMDSMSLVALTRATDLLVIYVDQKCVNAAMWLARCELQFDHENLNVPLVGAVMEEAEPDAPELEPPKPLSNAVGEGELPMMINPPIEQDQVKAEMASGVAHPVDVAIAPMKNGPDAGVSLTKASLVATHVAAYDQIADMPRTINNYATAANVVRSALMRLNQALPSKRLTVKHRAKWQELVSKHHREFKHFVEVDDVMLYTLMVKILGDADYRSYYERQMSAHSENPEPNAIGFIERATEELSRHLLQAQQRVTVKEGVKMNNHAKADKILAALQTIASQPIWQWFQFTFVERLTAMLDHETFNRYPKNGRYAFAREFHSEDSFLEHMKRGTEMFANRIACMGYGDGEKTDSGGTEGSIEVLTIYRVQLLWDYTSLGIHPKTREWVQQATTSLYRETRNNPVIAAWVNFKPKFETPSGYVATYSDATRMCSMMNYASVKVTGAAFYSRGGDDDFVMADHMEKDPEGEALCEATCNIKVGFSIQASDVNALDFVGFVIYSYVAGETSHTGAAENLFRKHSKVYSLLTKKGDVTHRGELHKQLRQWCGRVERHHDMYDTLMDATACNLFVNQSYTWAGAYVEADSLYNQLRSLSFSKVKGLLEKGQVRYRPANPLNEKDEKGYVVV